MKGLNLAEWAIRHKQIVYFFIIAIITGGLWSYFHLGRSEDPDFTIRQAVVTAAWPGASAQQITQQVTDPLEKKLQDTKGLDYIKSFTHDGKTVIYVNLKDSVPKEEMQTRWHEIRNLVNDEWGSLPSGVMGPYINDRFDDVYGSIYAVTGDGFSYEEKRKYAENIRRTIDWNRVRPYNYVRQIPAISGIDTFTFHKPITFFVGENGSGKSTLLEAIAVAYGFNAEGGTKNYSFSTYNSHSELCEAMTISKGYRRPKFGYFLRAESFYNVATKEIDYSDDDHPSKGYHQKSHGESFLAIAQDYMGADGVYIFDEPEAALSPQRQLTLLINIYRCAQEGAQFIIVSHSPILLGMPDAEIFSFDNGTIHPCQYEDTDSYVITKTFVNNRQHFLNQLLNEET